VGFSGITDDKRPKLSDIVKKLKGKVEGSDFDPSWTHLVVGMPLKRTTKLCAAVSLPIPIVTDKWLYACESANAFVSADSYLLKGPQESAADSKLSWSFNATAARAAAMQAKCFEGRTFYITTAGPPALADLQGLVRAAGGTVLAKAPSTSSGSVIVVSNEAEGAKWRKLAAMPNVSAIRSDHLLTCALRQSLDLTTGLLGAA